MGLEKDEQGKHKRIWIEQPANNLTELQEVQEKVLELNPQFYMYSPEKLHMTIFHLGIPDELFKEFLSENPDIKYEDFMQSLEEFLTSMDSLIPENTEMKVLGFDLLGYKKSPKVSLILHDDKEVDSARNKVIVGMVEIMNKFKINDQAEFIVKSRNLRYSVNKNYIPHLTLGSLNGTEIPFKPPKVDLKRVLLGPSRVSNFTR